MHGIPQKINLQYYIS